MAKGYFQFKQFKVEQDQTAMKVCTDACYFGAALAQMPDPKTKVLDIGTGTGLLSLMLAQAWPESTFLGLEIDTQAAIQARTNFLNSPWANRLSVMQMPLQEFSAESTHGFDLILSNPPFYENRLSGPDRKKNLAHHAEGLLQEDVLYGIQKLLNPGGLCYLLYPPVEASNFQTLAAKHGVNTRIISQLKDRSHSPIIRSILEISAREQNSAGSFVPAILSVKNDQGRFSQDFSKLLGAYYTVF